MVRWGSARVQLVGTASWSLPGSCRPPSWVSCRPTSCTRADPHLTIAGVEPDHGRADALLAQQRDRRRPRSCLCLAQDPSTAQQPDRRLLGRARGLSEAEAAALAPAIALLCQKGIGPPV